MPESCGTMGVVWNAPKESYIEQEEPVEMIPQFSRKKGVKMAAASADTALGL